MSEAIRISTSETVLLPSVLEKLGKDSLSWNEMEWKAATCKRERKLKCITRASCQDGPSAQVHLGATPRVALALPRPLHGHMLLKHFLPCDC